MITEVKRRKNPRVLAKRMFPEFKRLIEEIIVRSGATPNIIESSYDWILPTKGGILEISIQENLSEGPGSVMCRFTDPDHAAKCHIFGNGSSFNPHTGEWNHHFFGFNPHSGEWNHHFFGDWNATSAAASFQYALSKITLEREV